MTSKKHSKVCEVLNYIEHLLILVYTVTECVSISAFASIVDWKTRWLKRQKNGRISFHMWNMLAKNGLSS